MFAEAILEFERLNGLLRGGPGSELSAMMFRGRGGQTADAAAQARQAAARAQDLRDAARGAVPDITGALTEGERQQLGKQASKQAKAQQAAHELARPAPAQNARQAPA